MSRKYKDPDQVPVDVIADRLDDLANAVTNGRDEIDREFVMRIPAEVDHCPDIVMAEAAKRLRAAEMHEKNISELKKVLETLIYWNERDSIDQSWWDSAKEIVERDS